MSQAPPASPGRPAPVRVRAVRVEQERAVFLGSLVQDVPAAAVLLSAGLAGLRAPLGAADAALAVAEVAVSVWLFVVSAREARRVFARRAALAPGGGAEGGSGGEAGEAGAVDWPGIAGASLALVEVWHHWHLTGRVKGPTLLTGVVLLGLALGGRAAIVRYKLRHWGRGLTVSGDGVRYRPSRRHRFAASWDEVARVEHEEGALHLTLRDGRRWALRARDHADGHALVAAARAGVAAHAPARLRAPAEGTR